MPQLIPFLADDETVKRALFWPKCDIEAVLEVWGVPQESTIKSSSEGISNTVHAFLSAVYDARISKASTQIAASVPSTWNTLQAVAKLTSMNSSDDNCTNRLRHPKNNSLDSGSTIARTTCSEYTCQPCAPCADCMASQYHLLPHDARTIYRTGDQLGVDVDLTAFTALTGNSAPTTSVTSTGSDSPTLQGLGVLQEFKMPNDTSRFDTVSYTNGIYLHEGTLLKFVYMGISIYIHIFFCLFLKFYCYF